MTIIVKYIFNSIVKLFSGSDMLDEKSMFSIRDVDDKSLYWYGSKLHRRDTPTRSFAD